MSKDVLAHHGILGQKWGVRRFQNSNGSRTLAGKTKAKKANDMSDDELSSKVRRMNLESQYNKGTKDKSYAKIETAKKAVDAASTIVNQTKSIKPTNSSQKIDLSKMTDQQLRDRINRTNLENQYNNMFADPETVSRGKRYLTNVLDVAGPVLGVSSSALAIALAIKELRG